jgi:SAM-dependent methyltransferase
MPDDEPVGFETLYRSVGTDLTKLPWAALAPRPPLVHWLDSVGPAADRRALVVGCGLGDDAEELDRRGYRVTAFDISPTAIRWCLTRFPETCVDYQVADVLDLPTEWQQAFDIVVESATIQSIEPGHRNQVIQAIASTVAPIGLLFVLATLRPDGTPAPSRPWPVSRGELAAVGAAGLHELSYTQIPDLVAGHPGFVAVFTR